MNSRRKFIKTAAFTVGSLPFISVSKSLYEKEIESKFKYLSKITAADASNDEDFWAWVRECYTVSPSLINLNNGGCCPQPKPVQETHIRNYQFSNEAPTYNMWRILDQGREMLRGKLAELAGSNKEEIAINRNTTEGLNSIIFGLNLKAGDEVVLSKFDYPNMINAWKQREMRDGIKINWIDFNLPQEDENYFIEKYASAITSKTKIVHIVHMVHLTGQLLPLKAIAAMAKAKGCEVIADIAHSFAHVELNLNQLNVDYAATSLHKWLGAPFGSGMLYIKKEKIKNIWPLLSCPSPLEDNIRKFEHLGTRSFASEMAINEAIDFHNLIGGKRKEERLRYLKNYWVSKVKEQPGVIIHTPVSNGWSCALTTFSVNKWSGQQVEQELLSKHRIHTTVINQSNINGVRVTPNIYTSTRELDKLINAITTMATTTPD